VKDIYGGVKEVISDYRKADGNLRKNTILVATPAKAKTTIQSLPIYNSLELQLWS
jgi:hypothetical protein